MKSLELGWTPSTLRQIIGKNQEGETVGKIGNANCGAWRTVHFKKEQTLKTFECGIYQSEHIVGLRVKDSNDATLD